jgi:hypothetical protein
MIRTTGLAAPPLPPLSEWCCASPSAVSGSSRKVAADGRHNCFSNLSQVVLVEGSLEMAQVPGARQCQALMQHHPGRALAAA